jgi:hypothetical protein
MKKIKFSEDILPHGIAVLVFLIVTVTFFNPVFFDNKIINQSDIHQHIGSSKSLRDYRAATGKEGLWTPSMFSGMPAYLVNMDWSTGPVTAIKRVLTLFLPHPVNNIFLAFISYYILLLAFRIRPWLAIAGALAFGLSSYVIIGLSVGHNARIGAMATMPLVMAGVHLAFSGQRFRGFALTAVGMSLHLRENHLQITYYLAMIIGVYGLINLILAVREKQLKDFGLNVIILFPAVALAIGTVFGQLWSVSEYTTYSIRGPSELVKPGVTSREVSGLTKEYAFEYKYGLGEPMTLIIPTFFGGSSMRLFVEDQKSESYKALSQSSDNQLANQLVNYTSAYWGPQSFTAGPYYGGAIVFFLFVLGILMAKKEWVWWLVPLSLLSLMLSWGDNFPTFNYFMFDHFPGYNKFRSVSFALFIILFSMPLLGMLGLEKFLTEGLNPHTKKKLVIAGGIAGGICLFAALFAGIFSFTKEGEQQLPAWFLKALQDDRKSLLRADAWRSFAFILVIFLSLYFDVIKKTPAIVFYFALGLLLTLDLSFVDVRYFTKDNYQREKVAMTFEPSPADIRILQDTSYYRVYNLQDPMAEGRTSYFHHSLGGYHGAKLRRYKDLYDSVIIFNTRELYADAQRGRLDFRKYNALNMLNAKYITYGQEAGNVIVNPAANGNAWFVKSWTKVNSPTEELKMVRHIDTRLEAVIDGSKFTVKTIPDGPGQPFDSLGRITFLSMTPPHLRYESQSSSAGLAVFSEIYYPKGWHVTIDGNEVPLLRADFVLRAVEVPAGKHIIEFNFEPRPYEIGNKVTQASSWILLLLALGSIAQSYRSKKE